MIDETKESFKETLKEKIKNPFLGTYILVWCLRNWDFIYIFFTINLSLTYIERLTILKNYFSENPFLLNLGINILWTLGIIIASYILLALTSALTNLYENRILPFVSKKTNVKNLVPNDRYKKVLQQRDSLEQNIENEREKRVQLQDQLAEIQTKLEQSIRENNLIEETELLKAKIEREGLRDSFVDIISEINKSNSINRFDPNLNEFIKLGLLKHSRDDNNASNKAFYIFIGQTEAIHRLFAIQ